MEDYNTMTTVQDLYDRIKQIPESLRQRMVLMAVTDNDVAHDKVQYEAVAIVEDGAEVNFVRLSMNSKAL